MSLTKEKPKIKTVNLVVDFPDEATAKIFDYRWHSTAYTLGIMYEGTPVIYGDGKVRYEATLSGKVEQIKEIRDFMDKSLNLVVDKHNWPDVDCVLREEINKTKEETKDVIGAKDICDNKKRP